MKCNGCGLEKEFAKDPYCQRCEGRFEGANYGKTVVFEVRRKAQLWEVGLDSRRIQEFKQICQARWLKIGLNLINQAEFPKYHEAFCKEFYKLTTNITESASVKPAVTEPRY